MSDKEKTDLAEDTKALLGQGAARPIWKRGSTYLMLALIAAGAAGAYYWQTTQNTPNVSYVTVSPEKGRLVVEVSANGTIKPVRTVTIGSELSGIVRSVNVDVNDAVKKGDVLIELDDTKLTASVERAKASLALSQAALAEAQATLKEAQAKLSRLNEVRKLSGGKSPSKTEIDSQEAVVARSKAAVQSAEAKINDSREALKSAQTDLSKTKIVSPIDGVVLKRSVENGYAVAASLQAVELLSLATDMKNLELQVNVDEADVGSVKAGQPAYFTVSAYPDRRFPAKLRKVAFGSTTTDNVVTYVTYLDVKNPELALRPGMTATAKIRTVSLKDATLVPNTALRFKPVAEKKSPGGAAALFGPPMRRTVNKAAGTVGNTGNLKPGTVYVLRDGKAVPVQVQVGFTDGRNTQIADGALKPEDKIIIDQKRGAKS